MFRRRLIARSILGLSSPRLIVRSPIPVRHYNPRRPNYHRFQETRNL